MWIRHQQLALCSPCRKVAALEGFRTYSIFFIKSLRSGRTGM